MLGRQDALELARKVRRVIATRGSGFVEYAMQAAPSEEELLGHLLGRTGRLRAPSLLVGDTLAVGFNQEMYRRVLARDKAGLES
jgi:arsenate reductase-like glutaredoxin family protein